ERLTVHWKQRILRVLDGQRPLELPPRFEAFIDLAHQRVLAWRQLDGVLAHGAPGGAHAHSPPRSRPFTRACPYIGSAAFAGYSMDRPPWGVQPASIRLLTSLSSLSLLGAITTVYVPFASAAMKSVSCYEYARGRIGPNAQVKPNCSA